MMVAISWHDRIWRAVAQDRVVRLLPTRHDLRWLLLRIATSGTTSFEETLSCDLAG